MPTYDYLCENCGHKFEHFQSITAKQLCKCPECSKNKLKRLIGSGAGIIFKGSGFYQTDYRTENYKNGRKNAKADTKTSPAKDKPAKTKDSKSSKKTTTTKKEKPKS